MDGSMSDDFDAIIAAQDKQALDDYADRRGVSLDRRMSFENMLAAWREAMAEANPNVADDGDGVPEEAAPAPEPDPAPVAKPKAKSKSASIDPIRLLEMSQAWAKTFAADIIRVEPVIDGTVLTVTLATKHGTQTHTTLISDESEPEITNALESLRKMFLG